MFAQIQRQQRDILTVSHRLDMTTAYSTLSTKCRFFNFGHPDITLLMLPLSTQNRQVLRVHLEPRAMIDSILRLHLTPHTSRLVPLIITSAYLQARSR